MTVLGLSSKREVTRTSIRVRTAMAVQVREQGRYLGGRPPYGYRLGDAGPHPNKAHAAWGRRAHRLEPDPETAHVVRWIFAQRLAGHSTARIARALNDAGVPCPSAADPARNQHRTGAGWTLGTVTTILQNPRYTGRQVWNRQRTDKDLADPADVSLGHKDVQRWNLPDGWVISTRPAHEALVSEAGFIAAQDIHAARGPSPQADPAGPGEAPVPAGRAARLRDVRAANGISVVQRKARLPVPARPHHRQRARPGPGGERLHPRGAHPAAPARRAPAAHRPSRRNDGGGARGEEPTPGPLPARSRRSGICARTRSSLPTTRPPETCWQAQPASRQDHHSESTLRTPGLKGPLKGGARKDHRSPGTGGSPRPGDDPACPETGEYGELLCPRDLNPENGEISLITDLNSKTGEESPDRGLHAAMVAGAPRLASSGLRPADRGTPADAGYGRTRLASRTVAEKGRDTALDIRRSARRRR